MVSDQMEALVPALKPALVTLVDIQTKPAWKAIKDGMCKEWEPGYQNHGEIRSLRPMCKLEGCSSITQAFHPSHAQEAHSSKGTGKHHLTHDNLLASSETEAVSQPSQSDSLFDARHAVHEGIRRVK